MSIFQRFTLHYLLTTFYWSKIDLLLTSIWKLSSLRLLFNCIMQHFFRSFIPILFALLIVTAVVGLFTLWVMISINSEVVVIFLLKLAFSLKPIVIERQAIMVRWRLILFLMNGSSCNMMMKLSSSLNWNLIRRLWMLLEVCRTIGLMISLH